VRLRDDLRAPAPADGETLVEVLCAGVCATDLALQRGYMGFTGVPGHEFVGRALDGPLAGRRVVGEINAACGACPTCRAGLARHCPRRTVLGIRGRPGALAERLRLPHENLHAVPDALPTGRAAFTEPLAAAFEIVEQLAPPAGRRALVAGDGRLGLLCALVLAREGLEVTVAGRHPERAALLPDGVEHRTGLLEDPGRARGTFDLAVEATGAAGVLPRVAACVRPRGTVVLKTTVEEPTRLDLAPLVVDEITLVGSRCGPFEPALAALADGSIVPDGLVDARLALERGEQAFETAARRGVLKVLVDVASEA